MLAFLTVPFRTYSTLVMKLIVQEWGVCAHKMQVFWCPMFVATVVYSADEREFLDTLAKKRAMETPAIPRSHGRTPSGKIDCRTPNCQPRVRRLRNFSHVSTIVYFI